MAVGSINREREEGEEKEEEIEKKRFPALYILLAFIQAALTSGIIFGWPALQLALTIDGAFEHHCNPKETMRPCSAQSMYFNTIYTVALFANNISPLFTGVALDKFGPKWTNLFSFIVFLAGCIPFIIRVEYLYVLGYALLGFSGPGIYVSIMHLNNLFPGHQAFILSLFSGTFGVSSFVFKLFLILYIPHSWRDLSHLFIILVIVLAPFCLLGVVFWPKKPFELPAKDNDPERSYTTKSKLYNTSVKVQLKSLQFWLPVFWMAFHALHIHSYVGSVTVLFMDESDYISAFNWIWLGAVIAIPIFGIMLDKYGTTISFFVFSVLFLLFSIFTLVPALKAQFGTKNYGKILGVACGVVAVIGLIQYPLLAADINMFNYNFFYTNVGFTAMSIILFLVPFYLWRVDLKRKLIKPLLSVAYSGETFGEEKESLLSNNNDDDSDDRS